MKDKFSNFRDGITPVNLQLQGEGIDSRSAYLFILPWSHIANIANVALISSGSGLACFEQAPLMCCCILNASNK